MRGLWERVFYPGNMIHPSEVYGVRRNFLYVCMVLIILVLLILTDPLDRALSQWLCGHSQPTFTSIMNRSIFEGKALGAGDFAIFLQILVFGLWLVSFNRRASASIRHQ